MRAAGPRAEVIHWWTSGGESAAVRSLAEAYRSAGGVWVDTAIAGSEQARAVAISRVVGGNPPTAALFNTSKQFLDLVDQGLLATVDAIAIRDHWDRLLPQPILASIRIKGHYYAAPVSLHSPTWIWYSKAAFRKAGLAKEPASVDELFAALDRLKAAGLIPLAHGGQPWQENILFRAMLANVGGRDLYLRIVRDRDPRAIQSNDFRKVLSAFKRLRAYVDPASPGRNWNDATALLINGKAGVQIMGDWVKAEFALARQIPERDFGCIAGFGPQRGLHRSGRCIRLSEEQGRAHRRSPAVAREHGHRCAHAGGVQRQEGLDTDSPRCRSRGARCLRAQGPRDHEGQVASGRQR